MRLTKTTPIEADKLSAELMANLVAMRSMHGVTNHAPTVTPTKLQPAISTTPSQSRSWRPKMTQTKKLVCGTQKALDKEIHAHNTKGWTVERTDTVPRGRLSKLFTYLAYLKRQKQ